MNKYQKRRLQVVAFVVLTIIVFLISIPAWVNHFEGVSFKWFEGNELLQIAAATLIFWLIPGGWLLMITSLVLDIIKKKKNN